MAAVHESGNSVIVDVNPDVVQEDSNYLLGDASGNQPSSETQDVNPIEAEEDAGNQLNSDQYYQAAKGDFHAFEQFDAGSLTQLVTRVDKNTILHICVTAAKPLDRKRETARTFFSIFLENRQYKKAARTENNESVDFVNKALAKCKELLWQRNKKGETILHIAARHGHHDIVQVLLTKDKEARHNGQAINGPQRLLEMKNEVGDTALHEAVRYTHDLQVVKILINEDCSYQYDQNNDGETPLYIAAEMGDRDVVEEVLKCESPVYHGPHGRTALHAAVLCKNYEIVEKLCRKFHKLITRRADNSGWTPLHYAAQEGFASIVKLLLKEDKNAAYMGDKKEKKTALHVAASKGKAKVVEEFMLTCPDCFEQVDNNGQNVLHFAVEAGRNGRESLRIILDNECFGNLINAKDNAGDTPLHHLMNSNHPLALDLVYHPKLNARVFNKKHMSPLEVISHPTGDNSIGTVLTSIALKNVDKTPSRQIRDEDKGKEGGGIKDQDEIKKDESEQEKKDVRKKARNIREPYYRYLKDINLLISILISTVTFSAGFTIPGGYTSQGYPVLIAKPAFKVFVLSNTFAFVSASSGIFLHLLWRLYTNATILASETSIMCNFYAMIAMMVAFVSATWVVLAPNKTLVAEICLFSAFFAYACSLQNILLIFYHVKIVFVRKSPGQVRRWFS